MESVRWISAERVDAEIIRDWNEDVRRLLTKVGFIRGQPCVSEKTLYREPSRLVVSTV